MKTVISKFKMAMMATAMFALSANVFAQGQPQQGNDNKAEKIESLKRLYISQQLNLTPTEAEKFWPVYNQYQNDVKGLRENFKPGQNNQLTAEQQLDFEQKQLDLKKRYKGQFEGALGRDKVNHLYNVEREFREKLKELREQRQQMKGGAGPRPGGRGQFGNR